MELLLAQNPGNKQAQAVYLDVIGRCDLDKAVALQSTLKPPITDEHSQTDNIQRLIEEGMPERRKRSKETDVVMDGAAEVFIPKKRNRKVKYPKSYDPANPGPEPDVERWLPKWQRSKYKKMAKRLGKYIKGAQGDSQVDTDVLSGANSKTSTAYQSVSTTQKQGRRKGGRK